MKYTQKDIKHWQAIIASVFKAEDAIGGSEFLKKLKDEYKNNIEKVADEYTKAIAVEILTHTQL
jgi:hypothetical protein